MKILQLILLATIYSQVAVAQFNPSFEEVDSNGTLIGWTNQAGTAARATVRLVNALPFVATDRSHFVELIDDTTAAPVRHASIRNRFVLNDRPRSLALDYFYIPRAAGQTARMSIHLFNAQVDTILFANLLMPPVFDSVDTNAIRVAWQTLAVDIDSLYQSSEMPDSAVILISTSTQTQSANAVRLLYIDHMRLGEFLTGISKQQLAQVQVYPNPATREVNIAGVVIKRVLVSALDGKTLIEDNSGNATLNLQHLSPGMYVLIIEDQQGNRSIQKILKRAGE